ncbi:hypothetical protein ElyMa_000752000, partial [Elysia marginata]
MDFDSSAKFVASLAKFLQSLCNGYVDFDKGVEVIGHIHINVDSDLGKKVDYVLNERVCKNDNSITFISNSFPAQPAEKPQPPPKKTEDSDKNDGEQDETGQMVPNSTNVGTIGSYRSATGRGSSSDGMYIPGSKRAGSPHQHRNMGSTGSPLLGKHAMSQSPRYQDSGGPSAKMGRADIHSRGESYEGDNVFQSGGDEEDYSSNYGDPSAEIDQKPVIDPDISIVKEEYMANQQSSSPYPGGNQTAGLGRGKGQSSSYSHQPMMNQGPSNYPGANISHSQSEIFSGSPLEGAGDPSTLTRAQQEELEMYYRKGTDQHLTFLVSSNLMGFVAWEDELVI